MKSLNRALSTISVCLIAAIGLFLWDKVNTTYGRVGEFADRFSSFFDSLFEPETKVKMPDTVLERIDSTIKELTTAKYEAYIHIVKASPSKVVPSMSGCL